MFSLTVVFGPAAAQSVLLFKSKESLDAALQNYRSDRTTTFERADFSASDDFGQTIQLKRTSIHGVMAEDMEISKLAYIERVLHQNRTHARAEQMAAEDPVLKTARMRSAGAAMLSPGFNGAFRQ
jgi:hypothetical protein